MRKNTITKIIRGFLIFFISLFALVACTFRQIKDGSDQNIMDSEQTMDIANEEFTAEDSELVKTNDLDLGEKIIQTASLSYETTNFEDTLNFVNQEIEQHKAKIEHTSRGESSDTYGFIGEHISMTIRIPNEQLDPFIEKLNEHNNLYSQSQDINTSDATKMYRDNETRIAILKDEEETLRKMLKEQADLKEVLEIRTRLTEIITEREIFESENKNIEEQVDYSTIFLSIQQTNQAKVEPTKGFGKRILTAFKDSFYRFIAVSQQVVIAFVYAIPYLLIIGIFSTVLYFTIRKIRRK